MLKILYEVLSNGIMSEDIWLHLKTGELIYNLRTLPSINPFPFHNSITFWNPHEWLSQLLFYIIYSKFMPDFLFIGQGILFALSMGIIYRVLKNKNLNFIIALFMTAIILQLCFPACTLRPGIITLFFSTILLYFLETDLSSRFEWKSVFIVIIFLFWANFHGGVFLGLLIFFLNVLHKIIEKYPVNTQRRFIFTFFFSSIATMLNPQGLGIFLVPLKLIQNESTLRYIEEWNSPDFHTLWGKLILSFFLFSILILFFSDKKIRFIDWSMFILLSFLTFVSQRNAQFLGIFFSPSLAYHLAPIIERYINLNIMIKTNKKWATRIFQSIAARLRNVVNIEREITHNIFFSVTVILLLFVIVFNYPPQLRKRMSFDANIRQLLPVKAVNYMIDNKITGRLFNYYSWGGYIIFRTYPEKVIFIDGSLNYPTAIFNDYITTVMTGNWKDCFEKYQIDMVLLPVDLPLTRILINNIEWISLFEDENSILLKNKRFKPV